jgi:Zn-dependent protease
MLTSWKLGRVAGIDLFLHSTFLLLPLYIAMNHQGSTPELAFELVIVGLVFGCVVLHELGHALMARRYGIATADITLYPIGGVARLERMPRSAGPELAIALAGPAVNLAIAAILWALFAVIGPLVYANMLGRLMLMMMWINVGLLIFNMLPVFPMDGGRVLRALLSDWLGRTKATVIAANLGRGIAVLAGIAILVYEGLNLHLLLAVFIYLAATAELRGVRLEEARKMAAEDWPAPPPGYRWVDRGDGVWRLAPAGITWGTFQQQTQGRP